MRWFPSNYSCRPVKHLRRQAGFTLIEAALTTMIVGVGIASMMELFASLTRENRLSTRTTSAVLMANQIQEVTAQLPFSDPHYGATTFGREGTVYDDVDDFNNATFSPPISGLTKTGATIGASDMVGFSQSVQVQRVNKDDPRLALSAYTGCVRVKVTVSYTEPGGVAEPVYSYSFLRLDR